MTQSEYANFETKVRLFFQREGINSLSGDGEEFFSWQACDCCGTPLGGTREKASGYNPNTNEVKEYEVCLGCLYYVAYGQLSEMILSDWPE